MNSFPSLFLISLLFISTVQALYEDQIGKFDWRQQYVGKVSHALFDPTGKKIVVGTEENVVAVLHSSTGKIEWRHLLGAKSKFQNLLPLIHGKVVTVSGTPVTLRAFDLTTGVLQWETTVTKDTVAVFSQWAVTGSDIISVEIYPSKTGLYELLVKEYSSNSGTEESLPNIDLAWFKNEMQCQLAYPHLFCLENGAVNMMDVKDPLSHQRIPLEDLGLSNVLELGVTKSQPLVWLRSANQFSVFRPSGEGLVAINSKLPFNTLLVDVPALKDSDSEQYLACLIPEGNDYSMEILQLETGQMLSDLGGLLKLPEHVSRPNLLFTYLVRKLGGPLSYRYLISTEDDSLVYGSKKEVYWSREESLTSIVQVEMVDLPVSSIEASIEEEFASQTGGILSRTIRRISSQLRQLFILFRQVLAGESLLRNRDNNVSSDSLVRDRFGLHKLIVIVTRAGKVFAMDTVTGRIVWQRLLKDVNTEKLRLFFQRTSTYYPLEAQCTILTKSISTGRSVLVVLNPITGEHTYLPLGYSVQQALLLPQSEETEHMKPLLMLDHLNVPHVFPADSGTTQVVKMAGQLYLFTADSKSCLMRGYSLSRSTVEQLSATPVWQLQLCSSTDSTQEEIVSIVGRHPDEKVHSQGRVLADRSVLYKYLNPNLVVVSTAGSNHSHHRGYLNIYLIDVVSGAVVFSVSHRRVQPPYHVVHAENWVVYSYYNEKYRRTELGSLELLEGPTQSNTTTFSSFTAPQPLVDRQAYIYPAHITAMKDTFSEQGMTAKHVLLGLSNGWIQELPRVFLDPRRPVVATATPEMREEGVMPYLPELPTPAESIINYNQTVANVKNIYVSPSSLESTGLVFAYGLDIFFSHVTPSRTFDVLNEDFEFFFIALVLTGLTLASLITKRLASKKALRQAWK